MSYKEKYNEWLNSTEIDDETKKELKAIENNEKEIEDRFYMDLAFGTAGLRGIIGAGTNRMNKYVLSKTTQALATVILKNSKDGAKKGVAISYDCRRFSKEFAIMAAEVFAGNGIKSYLYDGLRSTPQLSFTVRHFGCISGIMITASHNPKEYNGYKVYWEEGSQILESIADEISEEIQRISKFSLIKKMEYSKGVENNLINIIGKDIDDIFMEKVSSMSLIGDDINRDIKIIYTPLNGTGSVPVMRILKEQGFNNVVIVEEQKDPDPNFTTVQYPNPENVEAFELAIRYGKKHQADILIATDPDADRLAVMVKEKDEYVLINGNQTGALLVKYILERRKELGTIPENGVIIKSIVTGNLGKVIAEEYGVKTLDALTGFKNICGLVNEFELTGEYDFIFGYEESIGFTAGKFVRDKDAVTSSLLLCEAAAYWKMQDKSFLDILEDVFIKHGFYKEKLIAIMLKGKEGKDQINEIMHNWRNNIPKSIKNRKLEYWIDYEEEKLYDVKNNVTAKSEIPKSNVLKFDFEGDVWYSVRPSGTEPKIKIYMYCKGDTQKEADDMLKGIESHINDRLKKYI